MIVGLIWSFASGVAAMAGVAWVVDRHNCAVGVGHFIASVGLAVVACWLLR